MALPVERHGFLAGKIGMPSSNLRTARKPLGISRNLTNLAFPVFYLYLYNFQGFLKGFYITDMAPYVVTDKKKKLKIRLD